MTLDDLERKNKSFYGFLPILGWDTYFKSGSIQTRRWRHLAYVNTSYPMSVAGFVRSGPSDIHRCRAFPFALARLFLLFVCDYDAIFLIG